jgi:hypothetical protein
MSTPSSYAHIEHVVNSVEHLVRNRPEGGALDHNTVLAFDVLTHALTFVGANHALETWREAMWQRRVTDGAHAAMVALLEYIMAAVARGEIEVVVKICDCLRDVVSPDVFGGRTPTPTVGAGSAE